MHATLYTADPYSAVNGNVFAFNADGQELDVQSVHATRTMVDLSGMDEVRISCEVSAASGSAPSGTLILEYYDGNQWVGAGASVTITGPGRNTGSWANLPPGADDVLLRVTISDESGNNGFEIRPLSITIDARA